jgi:hypothetical protein
LLPVQFDVCRRIGVKKCHTALVKGQSMKRWVAVSLFVLQRQQMLGPDHPRACKFDHNKILFSSKSQINNFCLSGQSLLQICPCPRSRDMVQHFDAKAL